MNDYALLMEGNPYAPNGAAGYMRRMYDNGAIAQLYGVNDVFMCHGGANFIDADKYSKSFACKAKQFAKNQFWKTRTGTMLGLRLIDGPRCSNALHMFGALRGKPDVVIFNDITIHEAFHKQYPDYPGLKVQILHNSGEFGKMLFLSFPKIDPDWVKAKEQFILADSDIIVFVGAQNKKRFDALYPRYSQKTAHVHLGIEDLGQNSQNKTSDKFTFVCVGTINHRKNQRVLLDVAADEELRKRCRFLVVGDGPEYESCKARAEELGLGDIVCYVGASSRVVDYYRQADALISVSRDEGLPTVALEAMSCGLPLVLTDVGGCVELIKGNGVLVPSCDAQAVISGVKQFLNLLDAGKISGVASRVLYEQSYTIDAMWKEYVDVIGRFAS